LRHPERACVKLGPNQALKVTHRKLDHGKHGAKSVPIAHADDKRQITAVLAANATGEYLPPQLVYKGKTTRCHPHAKFPEEWDI